METWDLLRDELKEMKEQIKYLDKPEVFDENKAESNRKDMALSHKFALKMTVLICSSIISAVMVLGITFGERSLASLGILGVIGIVIAIIFGKITYGACL